MNALVENIRIALTGLTSNKLRAALTMLGISIGVAAVIVLVSLGQAVQDYVADQFLGIGANLAFVFPTSFVVQGGSNSGLAANRFSTSFSSITERDVAALSEPFAVPDAKLIVPVLRVERTVTYGSNQMRPRINATTPDYFISRKRVIQFGRFFDQQDVDTQARVAVIGQHNLKTLFPNNPIPLNETIQIDGVPFKVIGILASYGSSGVGMDEDDLVAIPISTGEARLENNRTVSGDRPITLIILQAVNEKTMDAMVVEATDILRKTHNITFRNQDDFQILTQKDLLKSFGQITSLLTIFLGVIAGISLLVGGIGIMNIMLVTVTERTREIGLRKAVGARAGDVLLQFLTEATVLASAGGAAGLLIAVLGILALRIALPTLNATVRLESVILATTISASIGIFFGLYPASRAARLNPIDALRSE